MLNLSKEGVENNIEKCKALILQCDESTTRRRALVHKLIQLRLRLQVKEDISGLLFITCVLYNFLQMLDFECFYLCSSDLCFTYLKMPLSFIVFLVFEELRG